MMHRLPDGSGEEATPAAEEVYEEALADYEEALARYEAARAALIHSGRWGRVVFVPAARGQAVISDIDPYEVPVRPGCPRAGPGTN